MSIAMTCGYLLLSGFTSFRASTYLYKHPTLSFYYSVLVKNSLSILLINIITYDDKKSYFFKCKGFLIDKIYSSS